MIENVFAVNVAGAGGEGCAFVSAGVALFEAVEFDFCADGVHEAHVCYMKVYLLCVDLWELWRMKRVVVG